MGDRESVTLVQGELVARQRSRALISWLSPQEALLFLLGRAPGPGEDVTETEALYDQRAKALSTRPSYVSSTPIVEDHEFDLKALGNSPHLKTTFASYNWTVQVLDLRLLLGFQKVIRVDGLEERLRPLRDDLSMLADFCIPPDQAAAPQFVIPDPDQMGFTISSLNPNLRIAGSQVQEALVAPEEGLQPVPMLAVTFLVSMGNRYMQVAHYNGRTFLRDGYHRAAGLLRAGIFEVPCVYIEAREFGEVGADPAMMLSYETLFGDRPPSVADFWDDTVAAEVEQPSIRRVVRITGEQFSTSG